MKKIIPQNKIKVFDLAKLDNPKLSLMFDFDCVNCANNATCSKSKEQCKNCAVNNEITHIIADCHFRITIKTDSTKVFVDDGAATDDIHKILGEIKRDYTDPEIMSILVPRPQIPFKKIKTK